MHKMNRTLVVGFISAIAIAAGNALARTFTGTEPEESQDRLTKIMAGVQFQLDNPDQTPEQAHEQWLSKKIDDGWVYGESADADKKVHPLIMPYAELPADQRAKDEVFFAITASLSSQLDELYPAVFDELRSSEEFKAEVLGEVDKALASRNAAANAAETFQSQKAPLSVIATKVGAVAVEYIGRKNPFVDTIYGSGLTFTNGQVRSIPSELARNLLRHKDSFTEAAESAMPVSQEESPADEKEDDTEAQLAATKAAKEKEDIEAERVQAVRDQVSVMDNKALAEFAMNHYQQKINKSVKVETNRNTVLGFIDQFGVA